MFSPRLVDWFTRWRWDGSNRGLRRVRNQRRRIRSTSCGRTMIRYVVRGSFRLRLVYTWVMFSFARTETTRMPFSRRFTIRVTHRSQKHLQKRKNWRNFIWHWYWVTLTMTFRWPWPLSNFQWIYVFVCDDRNSNGLWCVYNARHRGKKH